MTDVEDSANYLHEVSFADRTRRRYAVLKMANAILSSLPSKAQSVGETHDTIDCDSHIDRWYIDACNDMATSVVQSVSKNVRILADNMLSTHSESELIKFVNMAFAEDSLPISSDYQRSEPANNTQSSDGSGSADGATKHSFDSITEEYSESVVDSTLPEPTPFISFFESNDESVHLDSSHTLAEIPMPTINTTHLNALYHIDMNSIQHIDPDADDQNAYELEPISKRICNPSNSFPSSTDEHVIDHPATNISESFECSDASSESETYCYSE